MDYAFPPQVVTLPAMSSKPFPVRRIFCVGADDGAAPFFYCKPADAILPNNALLPYPAGSAELRARVVLAVALNLGGRDIPVARGSDYIFGYAVALDMSLGDVLAAARAQGRPWDMATGFDGALPCSAITPEFYTGIIGRGRIALAVNGQLRHEGELGDMLWSVPDIIAQLSKLVELQPGDVILTGAPCDSSVVGRGDVLEAVVAGLELLTVRIA
jgi:fumarylpyruvate hydrolase